MVELVPPVTEPTFNVLLLVVESKNVRPTELLRVIGPSRKAAVDPEVVKMYPSTLKNAVTGANAAEAL